MIISLGEALIDFISMEALDFSGHPGGSPFNSSIAIARQGIPVQFLGRVSTDLFGKQLLKYLKENNVGTDYVVESDDPTTLGFVQKQSDGSAQYAFFANGTADRQWQKDDLQSFHAPEDLKMIHFGSISISQEPCGSVLTDFLISQSSSALLSFDPNIRPSLVPDKSLYMKRFDALCRISGIVKLSDEDMEWLYPEHSRESGIAEILKKGTALLALTEGDKGCRLFTRKESVHCPLLKIKVADSIGAGDTFHGALLSFLYKKGIFTKAELEKFTTEELVEMGTFANKAAGINCSRHGADPPWAAEMTI